MLLIQQAHVREVHTVLYKQYHLTNEAKAQAKKKKKVLHVRLGSQTTLWHGLGLAELWASV